MMRIHVYAKSQRIACLVLLAVMLAAGGGLAAEPPPLMPPLMSPLMSPLISGDGDGPLAIVIFIGGMDSDPTPAQIAGTAAKNRGNSGLFQLCGELQEKRIVTEYFNWNGTVAGKIHTKKPPLISSITKRIRDHLQRFPRSRVAIVGNSWGGHTAWQVAVQLQRAEVPLAIDLIVFLDPSSAGRAQERQPRSLPENVKRAIHYRTHNLFCWDRWNVKRLRDVDLGDRRLGYMKDGKPAYSATFDFRAHVAAEWDPRIHAEIRKELLGLLPKR